MAEWKMYKDHALTITGKPVVTVSGGQLVKALSSTGTTITGSTAPEDIITFDLCDATADGYVAVGIALHDAASGETLDVATRGLFRVRAIGTLVAGDRVYPSEDSTLAEGVKPAVFTCTGSAVVVAPADSTWTWYCGKALHDAVSGEYAYCLFDFSN